MISCGRIIYNIAVYAVVKIGGSQYKVKEGQVLEVSKLEKKPEESFEINEVFLVADGDRIQIGQPTVSSVKVVAKALGQFKGEKIRVARFKSKVRYRKVRGFRAILTKIQITQIGEKKTEKSEAKETRKLPRKRIIKKKE